MALRLINASFSRRGNYPPEEKRGAADHWLLRIAVENVQTYKYLCVYIIHIYVYKNIIYYIYIYHKIYINIKFKKND